MLNYNSKAKDSKTIVADIKTNLQETRRFIEKVEQHKHDDDPNRILHVMNKLNHKQHATQPHNSSITNRSVASISHTENFRTSTEPAPATDPVDPSYFTSLDRIEETIRFMEQNILCERSKKQSIPTSLPTIVQRSFPVKDDSNIPPKRSQRREEVNDKAMTKGGSGSDDHAQRKHASQEQSLNFPSTGSVYGKAKMNTSGR